jgi:hypothetical protein
MKIADRARVLSNRAIHRRVRTFRSLALASLLLQGFGFAACGGSAPPPVAAKAAHAEACGVDQSREYFCEDLLPVATSMPAPAPYQACPSMLDNPTSEYEPEPSYGLFDASYTEYTRKRAPPGHSCCFSWCNKLRLADPAASSIQSACQTATAFREEYCMPEPEAGTTEPVGAPYDRCPAAIVPPAKAVFHAPDSAAFDVQATATRRGKGQADCCYAWCSQAPPGSGILGGSPKGSGGGKSKGDPKGHEEKELRKRE